MFGNLFPSQYHRTVCRTPSSPLTLLYFHRYCSVFLEHCWAQPGSVLLSFGPKGTQILIKQPLSLKFYNLIECSSKLDSQTGFWGIQANQFMSLSSSSWPTGHVSKVGTARMKGKYCCFCIRVWFFSLNRCLKTNNHRAPVANGNQPLQSWSPATELGFSHLEEGGAETRGEPGATGRQLLKVRLSCVRQHIVPLCVPHTAGSFGTW